MTLADGLVLLGRLGRWQVMTYVLVTLSFAIPAAWQLFVIVFIGVINPHHCSAGVNQSLSESVPLELDSLTGELGWSGCSMYVNSSVDNSTTTCTNGWTYDPLYFTEDVGTITMEWDLVCEKDGYVETSQTIFNVGVCAGAAIFTPLADVIGRRYLFFICQLIMNIFGIAMAFSPGYKTFCIFQFITGAFSQGLLMCGLVISCELFDPSLRATMAQSSYLGIALGNLTLTGLAYLIRDWRTLQLVISCPPFICLLYFWWCPESLRWLIATGKPEEAMKILQRAARMNSVEMPSTILDDEPADEEAGKQKASILLMLKSPRPRRYMIIMLFLVFSNNLMYFGLTLLTTALPGDLYLVFFVNAVLEIPGVIFAIIFTKFFGRRWPLFGFHIYTSVFFALCALPTVVTVPGVDSSVLITSLALLAKFGVSGAFCIEIIYSQEVYPTVVRSTGLGITAGFGYVGAILAPYTVYLFRLYPWIPGTVFSLLSFLSAAACLFAPETQGRPLPETVEEIAAWGLTSPSNEDNDPSINTKSAPIDSYLQVRIASSGNVSSIMAEDGGHQKKQTGLYQGCDDVGDGHGVAYSNAAYDRSQDAASI